MPYAVRRLLVLPLMLVLAAVVWVLLPVVGVVQAVVALGVVAGRRSRWRGLRLWVLAAVYCAGECLCVLACLLLWLASNHALIDGNKRLALAAIIAFYGLNGRRLTMTNDAAYDLVIGVAAGDLDSVDEIAAMLRGATRPARASLSVTTPAS